MFGRLQMSIFSGLEKIVKENYPLADKTWYRIGGPADYYVTPGNLDELKEAVKRCNENNIPVKLLGFGSNILISDKGVKAAVIKLEGPEFEKVEFDGNKVISFAGADLGQLVRDCVKKELSGLESCTGIPGSIGGAIKMNAGGRFGDIGSVVKSVTLMDSEGNIFEKSKPELSFDYRSCNIAAKILVSAEMELNEADPENILRTVKEVWMYKKNSQPLNTRNSGCIFKNPRGQAAGALIDRAGLKGLTIGGAKVSEKHANFIEASDECSSHDVIRLIEEVRDKVRETSGTELELEVEIWK